MLTIHNNIAPSNHTQGDCLQKYCCTESCLLNMLQNSYMSTMFSIQIFSLSSCWLGMDQNTLTNGLFTIVSYIQGTKYSCILVYDIIKLEYM